MRSDHHNLKVHSQSGYNYKPIPAIILKGNWLVQYGFNINDHLEVKCENNKIIITKSYSV